MQFDYATFTNIGGRNVNEDATLCCLHEQTTLLAAVADGLGGHGGGEIASSTALSALEASLKRLIPPSEETLRAVCGELNQAVLAAQTDQIKMKTTLAMALANQDTLAFLHVGDSRIYYFHEGEIAYQSADHSVSQLAVLANEITKEQIRFHEDRSRLLRSLGSEGSAAPEIRLFPGAPVPGDALLLCTDGFWEYVLEKDMLKELKRTKTAKDWLERMTGYIRRRAGKKNDNNSAVAVRMKPAR
ncbi:MAG: PP2C family serine/threonine-protein phosphatase [Clostridiaceae bacterium]